VPARVQSSPAIGGAACRNPRVTDHLRRLPGGDCAVGATVRELTYRDRPLIVALDAGAVRPFYRGALIAPWPNRVADGRYTLAGKPFQVPINEVDRGHALHGLVHWNRWEAVEVLPDRIVLRSAVFPQDGYPFAIDLLAEYALDARGLTGRLTATNVGPSPAPYGCCPHPYLVAGTSSLDDRELTVPAATRLEVDERLIPVGSRPLDEVDCDFRAPSVIGAPAKSMTPSPISWPLMAKALWCKCSTPLTTPASSRP
jgi:aldose 1-epimerase